MSKCQTNHRQSRVVRKGCTGRKEAKGLHSPETSRAGPAWPAVLDHARDVVAGVGALLQTSHVARRHSHPSRPSCFRRIRWQTQHRPLSTWPDAQSIHIALTAIVDETKYQEQSRQGASEEGRRTTATSKRSKMRSDCQSSPSRGRSEPAISTTRTGSRGIAMSLLVDDK